MKSKKETGAKRQELLEQVARSNADPIVLKGSRHSDSSVGVWGVGNGKTVSFTLGEVRAKREELEPQC